MLCEVWVHKCGTRAFGQGRARWGSWVCLNLFEPSSFSIVLILALPKNKKLNEARFIFDDMSEKHVVSWIAMIRGYV